MWSVEYVVDDVCDESCCLNIAKNNQLVGEAGVAGPLVEVLKTHLQSAAVMEQACGALRNVAYDGEWRR